MKSFSHSKDNQSSRITSQNERDIASYKKIQINCKNNLSPKNISDAGLQTYFNKFPQQKKKPHNNVFNFVSNQSPQKIKFKNFRISSDQKFVGMHIEGDFIIKRKKNPYPSLNAQKLNFVPINSQVKLQKYLWDIENTEQEQEIQKNQSEAKHNKINQILHKNVKFDRKKYIYYRYRKKSLNQKNLSPSKNLPECIREQQSETSRKSSSFFNKKANLHLKSFQEINQISPQKLSASNSPSSKDKTFFNTKFQLTVEPIPKKSTDRLIDRKSLCKTTHQQKRHKIQLLKQEKNGSKIFCQAIHFKCRRNISQIKKQTNQQSEKNDDRLLGWRNQKQQHLQQYFF